MKSLEELNQAMHEQKAASEPVNATVNITVKGGLLYLSWFAIRASEVPGVPHLLTPIAAIHRLSDLVAVEVTSGIAVSDELQKEMQHNPGVDVIARKDDYVECGAFRFYFGQFPKNELRTFFVPVGYLRTAQTMIDAIMSAAELATAELGPDVVKSGVEQSWSYPQPMEYKDYAKYEQQSTKKETSN